MTTPTHHFRGRILILAPHKRGFPLLTGEVYLWVCPVCGTEHEDLLAEHEKYVSAEDLTQVREEIFIFTCSARGMNFFSRKKERFIATSIDRPVIARTFRVLPATAPQPRGYKSIVVFGEVQAPRELYARHLRPTRDEDKLCPACAEL
jgi:hypothetical protein